MFNLIKNEVYKILHKRGTFIVLIITALFITLVSYLIGHEQVNYVSTERYYNSDTGSVAENKTNQEMNELSKKYNDKTWQYYVMDYVYTIISNYNYAKEGNYLDENIENEYNTIKKTLTSDDWKYFVNVNTKSLKNELKDYEENLKSATSDKAKKDIEAEIYRINVAIEMNEYRLKENVKYGNDYINNAIDEVISLASQVKTYETTTNEETKTQLEQSVKSYYKSRYILENKEDINNEQDLRFIMTNFYGEYMFLILVFGVMIAGAIVSEEYNKGTIKSLLITPYKRSTILLSKFITVIIFTILFIIISYLMQIIIGGLFLGFSSLSNHVVEYNLASKSLEVMSLSKYVLLYSIANLPQIILLVTLAFAVSTIVGNTAFAIVITFAGVIGSSIINMFASAYKIEILKYFVTTNWDFNYYLFGGTSPYKIGLTHAIIVCIIYFLIMVITSFVVFNKKNIKNI